MPQATATMTVFVIGAILSLTLLLLAIYLQSLKLISTAFAMWITLLNFVTLFLTLDGIVSALH